MIRLRYLGIILFSIFFFPTHGQSKSNNVEFLTKCLDDSIEIQLLQDESFSGSIYIKGYEEGGDTCKKNYKVVKNPVLSVLHHTCASKNDDIVDAIAIIKPYSGPIISHNIKCDYTKKEVEAKAELRIVSPSKPPVSEYTKHNLQQNVMHLWKTINNVLCDCNLNPYVNVIKSWFKPSE